MNGDQWFDDKTQKLAQDAGILRSVESFLRGLPLEVRNKLTAGELADAVLKMIDNVRKDLE